MFLFDSGKAKVLLVTSTHQERKKKKKQTWRKMKGRTLENHQQQLLIVNGDSRGDISLREKEHGKKINHEKVAEDIFLYMKSP